MFGKKKKEEPKKPVDYTNWDKDLGFLTLILSRKKAITREFLIGIYSQQKSEKDYLTDEEIETPIENIVLDVLKQLSDEYREFLIQKYFGTKESLIQYITEDVYVDLVNDAIKRNTGKIKSNIQANLLKNLSNISKTEKK